jgi:SWI/SNF related-matrix-associated actin-dependent regulator of chromatin subfamily C
VGSYQLPGSYHRLHHRGVLKQSPATKIDPDTRPATLAPPFTGHFRVILDTPRGLQSLHPGTRPSQHPSAAKREPSQKPAPPSTTPASLELRSSIYQTTAKASRPLSDGDAAALANGASASTVKATMHACDTCGVDCTPVRYHSLKVKDFELCPPCYLDGRFPSTMFSGDFVKLTNAAHASGNQHANGAAEDDWTDQELLLLLEGIEMYDDDWSAVEEHVGTRNAQQCIRKFLELPIEDPYLQTEGGMGPLRFARLPFEQADNPVMSVVAFLAGVVSPGVASEAAKAALQELTKEDKEGQAEEEGEAKQGEGEDSKEGIREDTEAADGSKEQKTDSAENEDGMAVDSAASASASNAPKKTPKIPRSQVQRAASLALASSGRAAQALADAEDAAIRSTLAQLVKLTLTKLELKMAQFEELEDILEEERKGLESARMALVNERLGVRKMYDQVKSELAKHGAVAAQAVMQQQQSQGLGQTGQGTRVTEVQAGQGNGIPVEGEGGPQDGANLAALA